MEVPIFLTADYVNKGEHGKLNVLGIFSTIFSNKFPTSHPRLFLIIRIELGIGEFDVEHDIRVLFIDEDGKELVSNNIKLMVTRPEGRGIVYSDLIIEIGNLKLEQPGRHEFRLIINKDLKSIAPIDVVHSNSNNAE